MHQQPLDIREVEKHDFYLATRVFADGHEEKRRTDDERREILWTSSFALLPTDSIEATTKQEKRSESADSKSKEGKGIGRLSVQFLPEARLRFLGKERRHDARSAAQDGRLSPRAEPDDHGHRLDMLERRAAQLCQGVHVHGPVHLHREEDERRAMDDAIMDVQLYAASSQISEEGTQDGIIDAQLCVPPYSLNRGHFQTRSEAN